MKEKKIGKYGDELPQKGSLKVRGIFDEQALKGVLNAIKARERWIRDLDTKGTVDLENIINVVFSTVAFYPEKAAIIQWMDHVKEVSEISPEMMKKTVNYLIKKDIITYLCYNDVEVLVLSKAFCEAVLATEFVIRIKKIPMPKINENQQH